MTDQIDSFVDNYLKGENGDNYRKLAEQVQQEKVIEFVKSKIDIKSESVDLEKFKNWRVLKDRTVVQPPVSFLENIFTIRIHLDKCTVENGALRIVKKSHQNGIIPLQGKSTELNLIEKICEINQGGILIMKPLMLAFTMPLAKYC